MAILANVLRAIFDSIVRGLVQLVNDRLRDRRLERLGYTTARLEQMEADRKLEEEIREVASRSVGRDELTRRLRDGSF